MFHPMQNMACFVRVRPCKILEEKQKGQQLEQNQLFYGFIYIFFLS